MNDKKREESSELDYRNWAERFANIGTELMEKRSLSELLSTILQELRNLTKSDAGSIYRVIEQESGDPILRFEQAQNDSVDLPDQEFTLPIDRNSIAGYVACEGALLKIDDVYELSDDEPFTFNRDFDEQFDYRTKSMLVVPLEDRQGDVKGVLQLMNRKQSYDRTIDNTEILPYPNELTEMVKALSSQAAVAMERAQLDESIEAMIDSMIQTLVNALDQRDEITTGHSRRLAHYALKLAQAIDNSTDDPWKNVEISKTDQEMLYYAGLLHDIGKIAVPESVLGKKNRLPDDRIKAIKYRLFYLEAQGKIEDAGTKLEKIKSINQSGYLEDEQEEWLGELESRTFDGPMGQSISLLEEEEYNHLSIKKGNLTSKEREEIQSHAKATHEILKQVEWTSHLSEVPQIASLHHEKLDGTGYPWGLEGGEIPFLARILVVVDIYEALTARDRPYRSAMSPEEARNILEEEAEEGHLDSDIVDTFFEEDVYLADVEQEVEVSF